MLICSLLTDMGGHARRLTLEDHTNLWTLNTLFIFKLSLRDSIFHWCSFQKTTYHSCEVKYTLDVGLKLCVVVSVLGFS